MGRAAVARMVESLRHESFYVTGVWIDESLGVYVGWVERQGSFGDGMPLAQRKRGCPSLIFSGEEFPPAGPSATSNRKATVSRTSAASCLVHIYEEDPVSCELKRPLPRAAGRQHPRHREAI